ncbi:MAG: glycine dehydrogenase, partial [Candidatus Acidiferrales bacterium]
MRYLPKSPSEREEMLQAIGVKSVEELFQSIPARFRLKDALRLPGPLSEQEIVGYFRVRAEENARGYTSFLGAGVYQHLRSVVPDAIVQRGEFLTSYTPYQAEISQGTLTAIFEFQTLMAQLTGQEVANASMYDGSTALTEAVLMAERLTDRSRVLVARTLHPEYRQVLQTYAKHLGLTVEEIGFTPSG